MGLCAWCGKDLPERDLHRVGRPRKYCSDECRGKPHGQRKKAERKAARDAKPKRTCAYCGNLLGRGQYQYCSRSCFGKAKGFRKGEPPPVGQQKVWRDLRMANSVYRARRRTRLRNVRREDIDPTAVFERDGWRCGICGKKVRPELRYPDPGSASLDHIVPLNAGGEHTWANVQLAHFGCNSGKCDRGGGQLRLGWAAA